jgi:hypothetical protein
VIKDIAGSYRKVTMMTIIALLSSPSVLASETIKDMLVEYANNQAVSFSARAGQATWFRDKDGRSCTSCHSDSVFVKGRHERTGKVIEPMAPSVNPERYTDRKKINKWLLRNCKWTFKRECTIQEKGDVLLWLSQQ